LLFILFNNLPEKLDLSAHYASICARTEREIFFSPEIGNDNPGFSLVEGAVVEFQRLSRTPTAPPVRTENIPTSQSMRNRVTQRNDSYESDWLRIQSVQTFL